MKNKLWKKLFIITFVILIIFISAIIYFQSISFESFYIKRKIKRFEKNIERFNGLYSQSYINDFNLYYMMRQFEESNNAKIIIIDSSGQVRSIGDSKIDEDSSKKSTINRIFQEWILDSQAFNDILELKKNKTTIYYNPDFDINNIVCISPTSRENNKNIILAVSSLQPIEEASEIIKEFYIYIFIGALIIVIILSIIYANMISKPLIKLNNSAKRISEMDFSQQCDVNSDDELGNLAKTLNFLSYRLNSALTELQQKNIKLKQDIEKERKLDKMRKEFVAGVSHELRTPISIISGYAEGLKDNVADDDSREFYLDVIMDEASKMNALVSDMLDLSQLESGNFKMEAEPFHIDELMKKCINKNKQFFQQKNIKVQESLAKEVTVFADYLRIEQVITNFLTNAIRHTPENGVVNIKLRDEQQSCKVEIENQGEHLAECDLENIWDRFYKADKSRNRIAGGTGLGLSIVKNILLMHNSTFGVKNTKLGVCFFFTLNKTNAK
ncbi:MAG: HAMP domain-containing protein [Clostridia bacterium]|nr:HAMP domain-containing protein [Clostridia bacterium]